MRRVAILAEHQQQQNATNKYYAKVIGPDGKEMRVMVIPCRDEDETKGDKKPVAIVEPTGPSLEKTKGKTKGSKMLKTKRLDSVLSGIHAKKGFKAEKAGNTSSSSSSSSLVDSNEKDEKDGFDLATDCYQMKTCEGESRIQILKRVEDEPKTQKSSVSSSVHSNGDSETEQRKMSTESEKQFNNMSSPPSLEELEPLESPPPPLEENSSSGSQSPKPQLQQQHQQQQHQPQQQQQQQQQQQLPQKQRQQQQQTVQKPPPQQQQQPPQKVTTKPTPEPPNKPKTSQKAVAKQPKPRGRPVGSRNNLEKKNEKRRMEEMQHGMEHPVYSGPPKGKGNGSAPIKRPKQQTPRGRSPAGPKSRKTKDPTGAGIGPAPINKGSYQGPPPPMPSYEQQYSPRMQHSYQDQLNQPGLRHPNKPPPPPGYRPAYRKRTEPPRSPNQLREPSSAPYVYATPSQAPIRPVGMPPQTPSPIPPKIIPKFEPAPDDDAPLDLTMYSKKRQNGTLKTPPPPPQEQKRPVPQRVQNQPLNLKRIPGGKVIATCSVNIPKPMKTPSPVKTNPNYSTPNHSGAPPPPPAYSNPPSSTPQRNPVPYRGRPPPPPPETPPGRSTPSPVKKAQPPRPTPPVKLKPINMGGKHVVSVANVKTTQKRPPPPTPPPPQQKPEASPTNTVEKTKVPKKAKKQEKETQPPEDKSILQHRGKTIEQRLNMEFAAKQRKEAKNSQKAIEPENAVIKQADDDQEVESQGGDQAADDESGGLNQYAPRTKYPPPTPVENCKWPAIKTIKMANGETCGIKVGVQGASRGSISSSKLREVKQIIQQNEANRRRCQTGVDDKGPRFSPVVKPGPRPRIPRVDQASASSSNKRTNLLQRFSANQVVGSVKVKTPQGKVTKAEKKKVEVKKNEIAIKTDLTASNGEQSQENVPLVLSPENQALIKKYIDQNGGKSQFALTAVTPGTPINPAFPLVKVSKQEFQLIPVQDPPDSTDDVKTEDHYDAADLAPPKDDVKTEIPSPDKKVDDGDKPRKISLRNLSASTSPTKPLAIESSVSPAQLQHKLEQAASTSSTDKINIAPADAAKNNPGSIANQVAVRKARQPVVKKKEKPTKIKKIPYVGKQLVPLLPQVHSEDEEFSHNEDEDVNVDEDDVCEEADLPDLPETQPIPTQPIPSDYAPVTANPLMPSMYSTTSTVDTSVTPPPSANYIDTSIPVAHPDVGVPKYETVDQIKYKINKEIQETRTHSPATLGPEFIIYA